MNDVERRAACDKLDDARRKVGDALGALGSARYDVGQCKVHSGLEGLYNSFTGICREADKLYARITFEAERLAPKDGA